MVERGVYFCWSQVTRDSARKREDKRLSVELNADCRRCWLWRICDHGMESSENVLLPNHAKASRSGNL
jgi:hypothetical protein